MVLDSEGRFVWSGPFFQIMPSCLLMIYPKDDLPPFPFDRGEEERKSVSIVVVLDGKKRRNGGWRLLTELHVYT